MDRQPYATLGVEVALVAILVHAALSIVYGMFLALVLPTVDRMWGVLIGAFYGLALYYMNFYGFSAFSWFVPGRDWASLASHVVFGTMLAYAYTLMSAPKVRGPACHRRERRRSVNPPGQGSIHKFGL